MTELLLHGVEKSFGASAVLRGIDLTVPAGALAAVLGPSGCGKTTLLRLVAGFESLDAGTVRIDGRTVGAPGAELPPERRRTAIVPQEGALFPHLSVARNIGYGLDRAARRAGRVEEVLALVGLDGYGHRMPHELSGGQQQRVATARALAPRPSLVLLDEPFSALDAGLRAEVRADVRHALRADGATALLVTHDQDEALGTADLVAVLLDGRIVQTGTPEEVYRSPADLGVATFVGEAVVLPAVDSGDSAATVLGDLPLGHRGRRPGRAATVLVRPEQIELVGVGPDGDTGVEAMVVERTFHGHDTLLRLRVRGGTEVLARSLDTDARVGDRVVVRVRGTVHALPAEMSATRLADAGGQVGAGPG